MARLGLKIYPNEGGPDQPYWQFTSEDNPILANIDGRPYQVNDLTGLPWSDTITFTLRRFLWYNISQWWGGVFATGVTQQRLVTGEIVLYPARYPCQMVRACWDVMDKRTGQLFTETATGLVVITQAEVQHTDENWQLTLFRGDYYLNAQGELEASTKSCGGD